MKIVFNAHRTNLGNTGGCRTIVKSAQALKGLGHDVVIVARKNRYTWEKVKTVSKIPKCDACVAVSVLDIPSTLDAKAKKRAIWLRGWEKFLMPRKRMIRNLKKIAVIVNSSGLKKKLEKHGIRATVCLAGVDAGE